MTAGDRAGEGPARGGSRATADALVPGADALAELRAYLRMEGAAEDAVLARLLAVAIAHGEAVTGRLFLARGVIEVVPAGGPARRLARAPVAAIDPPEALAIDGAARPLAPDGYALAIGADGDGWVRIAAAAAPEGRARVAYRAGLADGWGALPEPLRQGAIRLAAHLFAHRDAADEGAPPAAVAALWRPWRRMRLS